MVGIQTTVAATKAPGVDGGLHGHHHPSSANTGVGALGQAALGASGHGRDAVKGNLNAKAKAFTSHGDVNPLLVG